jgi:hypothetical protein
MRPMKIHQLAEPPYQTPSRRPIHPRLLEVLWLLLVKFDRKTVDQGRV